MTDRPLRLALRAAAGLVATGLAVTAVTVTTGGGASARVADSEHSAGVAPVAAPTPATAGQDDDRPRPERGLASMSSPYVPGVWHVPADVLLTVGPGGTRYVGPEGSMFNGPTEVVGRRVDAWWAERLAEGLTPEQADRELAALGR